MSNFIDDLATLSGIQAYLLDNPQFAAHKVERLSGGMGNFTYRIHLRKMFAGCRTVVLKYAPPYIASSPGTFSFDQKRQLIEVQALRLVSQLSTANASTIIRVPTVYLFDEENHVIIMEDVGQGCRTLKELFIKEGLSKTISQEIGTALGKFIGNIHAWNQNPDIDLTMFANNQVGKYISGSVTYGRLESTLTGKDNIPTLSDPLLGIPEAKLMMISKVAERRQQAISAATASDPMTHGDLWPGNIVGLPRRGTDGSIENVDKVYVLDWELGKTGLPGLDLGQFCAEMYTLSEFYPAQEESARTMIRSFLGAYRELQGGGGERVELARTVVGHMGVHIVAFTPRIDSWSGKEKTREVVEMGVEMLILGEGGTESSLRTSIVGPLL